MLAAIGSPPPGVQEEELSIPAGNDSWTSRAIVTRLSGSTPGPLVVLYHGGGFAMGQPEGCLGYARGFASLFNAVVVSPSYRLAPEHKFPTGVNDAYATLKWCGENAEKLGADVSKGFVVGGSSAGANFAPVLARRSIEEGMSPKLTGQWLAYPVLGHHTSNEEVNELLPALAKYKDIWGLSWKQNDQAVVLDGRSAKLLFEFLKPDWLSPLFNPLTRKGDFDLGKMPKAFIQVAGLDLTRDDGIVFAYALEDAGVGVKLLVYPGVPHSFSGFFPSLEVSRKAGVDLAQGFAWLLDQKVDLEKAQQVMSKDGKSVG